MSLLNAAIANTLDLTTVTESQLEDLFFDISEWGWEMQYEQPAFEPAEYDALATQLRDTQRRLIAEQKRRNQAARDVAWKFLSFTCTACGTVGARNPHYEHDGTCGCQAAEYEAEQDGKHTLVGWTSVVS